MLSKHRIERLGRVVMLGPPNQGSELVDRLGSWRLFRWINGSAGQQLGTGPDSVPGRLGPVDFELGVIAGDRSINWINSGMIPGVDDGKVSVERTKVAGMKDHLVVHTTHPTMLSHRTVISAVSRFFGQGRFGRRQNRILETGDWVCLVTSSATSVADYVRRLWKESHRPCPHFGAAG